MVTWNSAVAIVSQIFNLSNAVCFNFDYGYWDRNAIFSEDAGHTHFFYRTKPIIVSTSQSLDDLINQADLHVYTGSQIQTHQSINGFLSWLNDVNQTLVSADFVLITRVFVNVRGRSER
ncbi:Uncharacterised protein [Enterobacter cloacae]|uniref:Uncharacterized protein n=1 Tax=Enterobacter cloacae TaxID=550 RepID=A0A377LRN9_ENTCL|nr:Uncharacterised protein [Enterobacter cloacae]